MHFHNSHWTDETLVDGLYTDRSDIHMVGRMVRLLFDVQLSVLGQALVQKMVAPDATLRPTAMEALADPWFAEEVGGDGPS